jgi:hypothetical protein
MVGKFPDFDTFLHYKFCPGRALNLRVKSQSRFDEDALMTILIGQHEFDGPVTNIARIPAAPGLYAILHKESRDLFLVHFDQSNNLAEALKNTAKTLNDKMVVLLRCENGDRRKEILQELQEEFEFEDAEPVQTGLTLMTETLGDLPLAV